MDYLARSHWVTFRELKNPCGETRNDDIMKTTQIFVFLGWLLASGVVSTSDVMATDLQYDSRARAVTRAGDSRARAVIRSAGCERNGSCCPNYTCASLYGAYGPWGGVAYWSRYAYGGWEYIR
jgi:hypothetical protein